MSCRVKDTTHAELVDKILTAEKIFTPLENQTQEETVTKLKLIRDLAEARPIDNSILPEKAFKDPSGKTEKYVDPKTGKLLAPNRITDASSKKFLAKKGKQAAEEINAAPDNKIKAWGGDVVHEAGQAIMEGLIRKDTSGLLEKNDDLNVKSLNYDEVKTKYGLSANVMAELSKVIDKQLSFIKETQSKINDETKTKGKAKIFTEQLILKQGTNVDNNLMGRGDVIVVFSDNSGGYLDYKTISPKKDTVKRHALAGTYEVITEDWIPSYKMEDFRLQLPTINRILKDELGIDKMRFSRVVPMMIQFELKKKEEGKEGARLKQNIKQIQGIGEYFTSIPLTIETTGIDSIDKSISKIVDLKNNLEQRLKTISGKEADDIKAKIANLDTAYKKLIVNKDMTYLLNYFHKLTKRYISNIGSLKDIDNPESDNYMSLKEINSFIDDIEVFQGVLASAPEFYHTLKLKEEDLQLKIDNIFKLIGRTNTLHSQLKEKQIQRTLSTEEIEAAKDAKEMNFVDRSFKTLSQQNNPIFQKFYEWYTKAMDKTRLATQQVYTDLKEKSLALEKWGSENGYTGMKVYEPLVNKETGDLHSEFSKDFWKNFYSLQQNEKTDELKKILDLKKDAQSIYKEERKLYIIRHGLDLDEVKDLKKLEVWEQYNDPKQDAITSKVWYKYYELSESAKNDDKNLSEGFKFIRKHKPLLDYYRFWQKSMGEARSLLGYHTDEDRIRPNFVPWIRKEAVEMMVDGGIPSYDQVKDKISEIWTVEQDNTTYGQISRDEYDFTTGKTKRQVPRFYVQPFQNKEGKIDTSMKSYDLNKSLLLFMRMAHNYNNLQQIEAQTLALQDIVYEPEFGETETDANGNTVRKVSEQAKKMFGFASNAGELFTKMVDYHLYGVHIQDKPGKVTEFLLNAKRFQQVKELGLAPFTVVTNALGIQAQQFFEGQKGFFYTKSQMTNSMLFHKKALIPGSEESKLYNALTSLFEPHGDSRSNVQIRDLTVSSLIKHISQDTLMLGYRHPEEHSNNMIFWSMLQNYGIDEKTGNIKRLSILPKDSKSLLDRSTIKDGKLNIDGMIKDGKLNEELYNQFRTTVVSVARNIKGSMSSEDVNAVHTALLSNLMMSFKTWLPGMAYERFGGLEWDKTLGVVKQGRYRAVFDDLYNKEDAVGFHNLMFKTMQRASLFALDVVTFGMIPGGALKINDARAKVLFDQYLKKNPKLLTSGKTKDEMYQEFIEYKRGQIKAAAIELRAILILTMAIMTMGKGVGDDWYSRTAYRQINRLRRELSFFISPNDMVTVVKGALPIVSLATDVQKWVGNLADESRDTFLGEDSSNDMTPPGYYTIHFIPGYRMFTFFEPYEQNKRAKY